MESKSIKCDSCGKELIEDTQYPHNYILELRCRDVAYNTSGSVYAVMMYPPIDSDKHFCGIECLGNWANNKG